MKFALLYLLADKCLGVIEHTLQKEFVTKNLLIGTIYKSIVAKRSAYPFSWMLESDDIFIYAPTALTTYFDVLIDFLDDDDDYYIICKRVKYDITFNSTDVASEYEDIISSSEDEDIEIESWVRHGNKVELIISYKVKEEIYVPRNSILSANL